MKRKTSHWVLLALALSIALLLAACGASGSAAEGSQQEESVTGTINCLDTDYLVLITDDVEYTEAKQICDTLSGECLIEERTGNNVPLCYETMAEYKRKGVLI